MARLRSLSTPHTLTDTRSDEYVEPSTMLVADAMRTARDDHRALVSLLVEDHIALADSLARHYAHRGVDLEDLVQVARLGLLLAAQRYRPCVGVPFVAFAVPTIRGELKRHFRDHGWVVRPPRRLQELRARVRSAREELEQRCGHTPSIAEVAECLCVNPAELAECEAATTGFSPISLDASSPPHQAPLSDRLPAPTSELDSLTDVLSLRRELSRLTPRDQRIVTWRFVDGLTQSEIGNRLGVSQMQVSRILSRIIRHLRESLDPVESVAS